MENSAPPRDSESESPRGDSELDLLIVVPHLGAGGTQRVVSLLMNHWHNKGWRLMLMTVFPSPDAYRLDQGIPREDFLPPSSPAGGRSGLARHYFNLESKLAGAKSVTGPASLLTATALRLMRFVRRIRAYVLTRLMSERSTLNLPQVRWLRGRFEALRPPVIISFLGATNILTVLAARGLDTKVVISERNDPAVQRLEPPWERLRPKIYPEADLVTANSAGALETMRRFVPAEKLHQVNNPLDVPPCANGLVAHQNRLICVARLVHQKGVDVLLDAFARVAPEAPSWHLDIIGCGPLGRELEQRALRLGIGDRVIFHGHQADPFPFLYRASVFVLPSRFEGMPNAMLEAMGCGLAIIVSDASPGPLELIHDGDTGLVVGVNDVPAFARAMTRIIADPALRSSLARAALKVAAGMKLDTVAAEWERLLLDLGVDLCGTGQPGLKAWGSAPS